MRCFEKISFEQFKKDIKDDFNLYESYNIPKRYTKLSVGYDFEVIEDFILKPKEINKIPTGIKVQIPENEMLMIVLRGSTGFKYNVRMTNQVGIIEGDYYNNENNEGHMFLSLQNEGTEDFVVKKGDRLCQGIFVKIETVDNEEEINATRLGGFGSTNN